MSFSSKITSSDLTNKGVIGLPDTPGLSTSAMQNKLEETVRTVAIPKHNDLIDELENSSAAESLGAVAPAGLSGTSVQALINDLNAKKENNSSALPSAYGADPTDTFNIRKLTDTYKIAFSDLVASIKTAIGNATTSVSGLFSDTDKTKLDGIESGAQVNTVASVNSMTGSVVLTASDVGALPDSVAVPTKTSDLTNDSGFVADASYVHTDNNYDATAKGIVDGATAAIAAKSTVTWNQQVTTGQRIATVTIDGTATDVYAPTGGSPGTGAVDSVNGMTGTVVLDVEDLADANFSSISPNDAIVRNSSNEWVNIPLPPSALSGSYADLSGKPILATVATSGSYNDLSNKPTIPAAQVNSDWNASSGVAEILNKPTIPTVDQTYSSSSTNAQSGTAVASAISGKANSSDLDEWTTAYTTLDGTTAVFSNLNDAYGYDLYCENKLVGISNIAKTGSGTSTTLTYTVTGASIGDVFKLRVLK